MRRRWLLFTVLVVGICLFPAHPLNSDQEDDSHFLNGFVVEVEKRETAEAVARAHGFIVTDELPDLGLFHLEHPSVEGRSKRSADHLVQRLKEDTRVSFVEQQKTLVRVKRNIIYDKQVELPIRDIKDKSTFYRVPESRLALKDVSDRMHFNDPYYDDQWSLSNRGQTGGVVGLDMNVNVAWKNGITGRGVVVTILDDGLDHTHPDIIQNYDARASADLNDRNDRRNDPMPNLKDPSNSHGTRCAGEVAGAADDNNCGVGIAYNCRIGGIRLLDGSVTDWLEARALNFENQYIHVYSASWGPQDNGKTMDAPRKAAAKALKRGATEGRGGLGSIYAWASGNGGAEGDDCDCDGYVSSIYTLSVGSINENGKKPYYMESCSSTMVVAPTGGAEHPGDEGSEPKIKVVTTDVNGGCTLNFEGTSSAAPLAAGCLALLLEANPNVTWRDVQHITVEGARIPSVDDSWSINGAGFHVSHLFGFGMMDCGHMVQLAQGWTNVPEQHTCETPVRDQSRPIPSGGCVKDQVDTAQCQNDAASTITRTEHVLMHMDLDHSRRGDVEIYLTSPDGTRSEMLSVRPNDAASNGILFDFMTVHNWGENPSGVWKIEVCDNPQEKRTNSGRLKRWSLTIHGTDEKETRENSDAKKAYKPTEEKVETLMMDERQASKGVQIKRGNEVPIAVHKKMDKPAESNLLIDRLSRILSDLTAGLKTRGLSGTDVVDALSQVLDTRGLDAQNERSSADSRPYEEVKNQRGYLRNVPSNLEHHAGKLASEVQKYLEMKEADEKLRNSNRYIAEYLRSKGQNYRKNYADIHKARDSVLKRALIHLLENVKETGYRK